MIRCLNAVLRIFMIAGASGIPFSSVFSQEVKLVFATTNLPNLHANVRVLHPWANRINEQGKGVVRIDVRDGPTIANQANNVSRVLDDVVQISWGNQFQFSSRFPLTQVATLPLEMEKSEYGSLALWRLYKAGMLNSEYSDIVPLALVALPQASIHATKPMAAADDMKGMKIIPFSKQSSDVVRELGGAPLSLTVGEMYEALQRGSADGAVVPWTAIQPFKLAEVTSYHVDGVLGGVPAFLFMARKKYDALPANVRKIFDENSGEELSRSFGAFWDDVEKEGRDFVVNLGNKHTIVSYTAEQNAKMRQRLAGFAGTWSKTVPGGEGVLTRFREEYLKARAEKGAIR